MAEILEANKSEEKGRHNSLSLTRHKHQNHRKSPSKMVSSQPKDETERTSTTNNSDKVASMPGNDQDECERERMLSLLCQEELSSPFLHASSNAATASIKRTEDQSRSSSSADASVMEYSLATNMSEEISRLIFRGERRAAVPDNHVAIRDN